MLKFEIASCSTGEVKEIYMSYKYEPGDYILLEFEGEPAVWEVLTKVYRGAGE